MKYKPHHSTQKALLTIAMLICVTLLASQIAYADVSTSDLVSDSIDQTTAIQEEDSAATSPEQEPAAVSAPSQGDAPSQPSAVLESPAAVIDAANPEGTETHADITAPDSSTADASPSENVSAVESPAATTQESNASHIASETPAAASASPSKTTITAKTASAKAVQPAATKTVAKTKTTPAKAVKATTAQVTTAKAKTTASKTATSTAKAKTTAAKATATKVATTATKAKAAATKAKPKAAPKQTSKKKKKAKKKPATKRLDNYIGLKDGWVAFAMAKTKWLKIRANAKSKGKVIAKTRLGGCVILDTRGYKKGKNYTWLRVKLTGGKVGYVKAGDVMLKRANLSTKGMKSGSKQKQRRDVCKVGFKYMGTTWVEEGTSLTKGIDCKNFVYQAYKSQGIDLGSSSFASLTKAGHAVSRSKLALGDLVFYHKKANGPAAHVAIYIGNNLIINASAHYGVHYPGGGIRVSHIDYRNPKAYHFRRVI